MTYYSYILVREDLPQAVQVVQASHAAMEVGFVAPKPPTPVHFVVLGVKNQEELMKWHLKLQKAEVSGLELFFEPDYDTGFTAICTHPKLGRLKELSKLKLLGK